MNALDNLSFDQGGFAWRDIQGQDVWNSFAPVFGSLTVVGATAYTGRYRFVGRQGFFQVKFSAATSVASTAGTSYLTLPFKAIGLSGSAIMSDVTTKNAVGECHVDVVNSRVYLPLQPASSDVFNISGWAEI